MVLSLKKVKIRIDNMDTLYSFQCMPMITEKLRKENLSLKKEVRALEGENENLRLKIQILELAQAQPVKPDDDQQCYLDIKHTESVRLESDESDDGANEASEPAPQIPSSTTKRKGKKRVSVQAKFEHLPVTEELVLIPEEVQADPDGWKELPSVVTHEVLVHPTRLSRRKIVQKKYVRRGERDAAPIMATAPIRFSSSYVSISLAVYIVLSKYLEHGTLYRLEQKFARLGADITRQSQSDIVERFAHWMRPLYELIEERAKASGYLQIDETFIKYINGTKPGSGQGYFWAINAPGQSMVLKWIDNRRHENVDTMISGFSGILQSDGYAAYQNYAHTHPGVTLAACWAHAFRKFRDALTAEPDDARSMMKLISSLYKLEEKWDTQGASDSSRKILRATESKPILESIKRGLDAYAVDQTIPANEFRKAVSYMANQWTALKECFEHGHIRLDTNLTESKFRPTKIGEKNWLFVGHPDAGQKSAIAYTLLNCCRIHRIDPQAYLNDVLEKLVPCDGDPPAELLEALLPENWAKANPDQIIKEPGKA